MHIYKRVETKDAVGNPAIRYIKDGKPTKAATVPPEVLDQFKYSPIIEYDDNPDERRCLFCDAPQERIKRLNNETLELCEWHYQNKNLGQVAAQVRLLKEQERRDGLNAKAHKGLKTKRKQRSSSKTKVALNYVG